MSQITSKTQSDRDASEKELLKALTKFCGNSICGDCRIQREGGECSIGYATIELEKSHTIYQ